MSMIVRSLVARGASLIHSRTPCVASTLSRAVRHSKLGISSSRSLTHHIPVTRISTGCRAEVTQKTNATSIKAKSNSKEITSDSERLRMKSGSKPSSNVAVKIAAFTALGVLIATLYGAYNQYKEDATPQDNLEYDNELAKKLQRLYQRKVLTPTEWQALVECVNQQGSKELANVCNALYFNFAHKKNIEAGYMLLVLLKVAFRSDFQLPKQEECTLQKECTVSSLKRMLQAFWAEYDFSKTNDPPRIAEILSFCDEFMLKSINRKKINTFFIELLCINMWPYKDRMTIRLFQIAENKQEFAEALINANYCDELVRRVSIDIIQALKAKTYADSIPYFQEIRTLLPLMDNSDFECLFKRPFPAFIKKPKEGVAPLPTMQLNFNTHHAIMKHGSLLIGVYRQESGDRTSYLLAYDIKTQKMVWGQEIPEGSYVDGQMQKQLICHQMSPLGIIQLLSNDKNVNILDPATGKLKLSFTLPEDPRNPNSRLFAKIKITPSGFCYFPGIDTLYGAKINEGKWEQSFAIKKTFGNHSSSFGGNFALFHCMHERTLVDTNGIKYAVADDTELQEKNGKLYVRENNTLSVWANVESYIQKQSAIKTVNLPCRTILKAVTNDEMCILESYIGSDYFFVDIDAKEVTKVPRKTLLTEERYIDPKTNAIWVWDAITKDLWRLTKTECIKMGTLEASERTQFVHAEGEKLYFVDAK